MKKTKDTLLKKDNIIKRWYKLAEPHKGHFAGQILYYIGYTIMLSIITIFAAKTINCMYEKNWTGAFIFLALELATIVLRNVSIHFQYKYYGKQCKHIRMNVAKKVYNKLLLSRNSAMKEVTNEKILNIALNNMSYIADFPDAIASFIAYSFQVAITLVTVFVSSPLAGVVVIIIGVVNFFAYYKFNKKLGNLMLDRYEKKDEIYQAYSKVIDGRSVITELNSKQKYKKEVLKSVENFGIAYEKYYNYYSLKNNLYFALWNVFIYAITATLLFVVSQGHLDITIYLIIVPYLSTCTDKLCTLFDKTSNLENMRVDVDRVNIILNLNEKQLIKYGTNKSTSAAYNLGFVDVSFKNKLKDVDISFKMNDINVIKGEKGSGKRVIFDILRRFEKPSKGIVLLDNLNLFDYNNKTFKKHIDYCASHPIFIKGTIKENLNLVEKSMKKIKDACKLVDILDYINKLPNGFNTNISEIKSSGHLFLIGLVRALLSNSNILMIYETPQDTDEKFRQNIVKLLKKNDLGRTIILFTHSDDYDKLASLVYEVKDQTIKIKEAI